MRKIVYATSALVITFVLSGCGVMPGTQPESFPAKTIAGEASKVAEPTKSVNVPSETATSVPTSRTEVVWADYDSGTQTDIDLMTAIGDCVGIQTYFGMATATEGQVLSDYGHDNKNLVKYLNEALSLAGCEAISR